MVYSKWCIPNGVSPELFAQCKSAKVCRYRVNGTPIAHICSLNREYFRSIRFLGAVRKLDVKTPPNGFGITCAQNQIQTFSPPNSLSLRNRYGLALYAVCSTWGLAGFGFGVIPSCGRPEVAVYYALVRSLVLRKQGRKCAYRSSPLHNHNTPP
jgi:hypothetical protein